MKRWYLFSGILMAVLGLLLIIFPAFWVKLVVVLLGLASIAYGIYSLKYTKSLFEDAVYERSILIKSIISIVVGAVVLLFPLTIARTAWTFMIWILIIYLIVSALIGFFAASLLKDSGLDRKKFVLENLMLLLLAVVLILLSPEKLGKAIIRIVGLVSLIAGAGLIIYEIMNKNKDVVLTSEDVEVKDDDSPEENQ